jgi:DNA-binding MarR family transcriptional regulator
VNGAGLKEKLDGAPHSKQSLRLWLRLLSCTTLIEKRLRQMLIDRFDTTLPRFDVLAALDRAPDGLNMGELSSMLLVSNGNVTAIVGRLASDGLVERAPGATDRRVLHVKLTERGRTAFHAMAAQHEAWIDQIMSALGQEEIDDLLARLDRIRISIEKSGL